MIMILVLYIDIDNNNNNDNNNNLPYAPGELQMEPETEGCLNSCGGAI
jgi:hypothetical protein